MRFKACRWWRGGHSWGEWKLAEYRTTSYSRYVPHYERTYLKNERTCGKCNLVQAVGMTGG